MTYSQTQSQFIIKSIALGLLMVMGISMVGQTYHLKSALLKNFPPKKEVWVVAFNGLWDLTFHVDFLLAYDDLEYYGVLQFKDSRDKLFYEGKVTNSNTVELKELSENYKNTGGLTLVKNETDWSGFWSGLGDNITIPVHLVQDRIGKTNLPSCQESYGVVLLTGHVNGNQTDFKLYKDGAHATLVVNPSGEKVTLERVAYQLNTYQEEDVQLLESKFEKLSLKIQNENAYLSVKKDGVNKNIPLRIVDNLDYSCLPHWVSFGIQSKSIFPDIENKNYKEWIDQYNNSIYPLLESAKVEESQDIQHPDYRNANWIGIDVKISYYQSPILSGDVFVYDGEKTSLDSFVYDVRKDKFYSCDDIVNKKVLYELKPELNQSFAECKFTEGGLVFHDEFDVLKGVQENEISYEELAQLDKKVIKVKSLRSHFLK